MENKEHRLIVAAYELFTIENGEETFVEQTEQDRPMTIYTNCEMSIKSFEEKIVKFADDSDFDFTLSQDEAYGPHDMKAVLSLDKTMFERDGKFDSDNVKLNGVITLQNDEGRQFLGKVIYISDDKVTVDLNHPLAGKDLHFKGHVIMNREASEEEVQNFFNQMNQHSCSGNCGGGCGNCNCGGGCGSDAEGGCNSCNGCH